MFNDPKMQKNLMLSAGVLSPLLFLHYKCKSHKPSTIENMVFPKSIHTVPIILINGLSGSTMDENWVI